MRAMDVVNPEGPPRFRLKWPDVSSDSAVGVITRLFRDTGRRYWLGYTIASIFLVIASASTAATAWVMKDLVDRVFIEHRGDWLIYLSTLILAISILRGVGSFGSTVALSRVGNSIVARTQKRLYDHLLTLGMDFYNRTHSSDLVTRMSYNANSARQVLNTVMTSLGRDLLSLIGLVTVMVVQNPAMSAIALVIGPVAFFGVQRLVKRVRSIAKAEISSLGQIISVMQETAQGIR